MTTGPWRCGRPAPPGKTVLGGRARWVRLCDLSRALAPGCVATGAADDVLRPDVLARYYGVRVRVHHEPDGTVVVIPRPPGGTPAPTVAG